MLNTRACKVNLLYFIPNVLFFYAITYHTMQYHIFPFYAYVYKHTFKH